MNTTLFLPWLIKTRASDWERQRPAGRRRVAPPEVAWASCPCSDTGWKPVLRRAGRMPALPVADASSRTPTPLPLKAHSLFRIRAA